MASGSRSNSIGALVESEIETTVATTSTGSSGDWMNHGERTNQGKCQTLLQSNQPQLPTTKNVPTAAMDLLTVNQPCQAVAVLPAQPVQVIGAGGAPAPGTGASVPAGSFVVEPVIDTSSSVAHSPAHKYTVLKTQQPTDQQSKDFESFLEHMEVFLVEVFRCKLCKFHSALKGVMAMHMREKHFPGAGENSNRALDNTTDSTPPVLSAAYTGGEQTTTPQNTPVLEYSSDAGVSQSRGSQVHVPVSSEVNSSSAIANALELLMGIGNQTDADSLKSKEIAEVRQSQGKGDSKLPAGTGGLVSVPELVNRPTEVDSSVTKVEIVGSHGPSKKAPLVTVDEVELAKTLKIDSNKDSEGESLDDGEDEESDDHQRDQHSQDESSGKMVMKPIPVQIGVGAGNPSYDIQDIANTASKSNPQATTITVLQHGPGNGPPTAIQFKKSKKSKAVIPTGVSLGIDSPFSNRSYRGTKNFPCSSCHARYKFRVELERHIQKKHQRLRKFLCEICGEELATKASVKYHVSKKHDEVRQIFNCCICDYSTPFEARIVIHQATHQSEFFCELCKKSYVSAERLAKHFSSPMHKNALNPLVCEHCGYSTKKRDNFLVHMRKHTGEKPYKCKVCDYASADGSTLKKHVMAKHSSIRPFKCDQCTFSCVDKKGLDIHVRKHTGERPFKCQYCLYAAKRRSALNVHMQTHQKDGTTGKGIKAKSSTRLPTEVASYETVAQTSLQEHQYTTMDEYQPSTASKVVPNPWGEQQT